MQSKLIEDLPLHPPFAVFSYGNFPGEYYAVLDQEGRTITMDFHSKNFMEELCEVMNENADRLVKAWQETKEGK